MTFRRIIVGLDGSDHSRRATRCSCRHVTSSGGTVIGVAIIDLPTIEARSKGAAVGASGYAKLAREAGLEEARQKTTEFVAEFEATCREAGVSHEIYREEGVPHEVLARHGRAADLIVIGLKTHFHFATEEGPGDTLRALIEMPVCPILAVPDQVERLVLNTLIAYDGSPLASQAMHAYVLMHRSGGHDRSIEVLRVDRDSPEIQAEFAELHKYFEAHKLSMKAVVREGDPSEVLLEEARKLDPALVVLGSRGRSGFKKFFLGSTADELIKDGQHVLFIYS